MWIGGNFGNAVAGYNSICTGNQTVDVQCGINYKQITDNWYVHCHECVQVIHLLSYTTHCMCSMPQFKWTIYIYIWLPNIPNLEEFIPTLLIWYLYTRLECILHGIMTSDTILWPYISSRWCISLLFYFCQQCKQESWWNQNQVGKEDEIYMLIWTTASWRMKLVYCQSSCISHN